MRNGRVHIIASLLLDAKGALNIITIAITLPILLLLATAAVDIIRLPIVEQQLQGASLLGFDSLMHQSQGKTEAASGFTWCALVGSKEYDRLCKPCPQLGKNDCSGAKDSAGARSAVRRAVESIYEQLSTGAMGVTTHEPADLAIDVSIYNVLVDEKGKLAGKELVAQRSATQLGATLSSDFMAAKLIDDKFLGENKEWPGPWIDVVGNNPVAVSTSVAIIHIETRVEYIFGFLPKVDASERKAPESNVGKEKILRVTLLRPLTRGIRLSGD